MANSFFSKSARWGPTPFRYSIGCISIVGEAAIDRNFSKNNCLKSEDTPRQFAVVTEKIAFVSINAYFGLSFKNQYANTPSD